MRSTGFVLGVVALAGCYQPSLEDACNVLCGPGDSCPNGSVCVGQRCHPIAGDCRGGDASVDGFQSRDAMVDAFGNSLCTLPTLGAVPTQLINGSDFTVSGSHDRAAKLTSTAVADIAVYEGASVDSPGGTYDVVISPDSLEIDHLRAPRMAPDGGTIFMRGDDFGGTAVIAFSNRTGARMWTAPQPLILRVGGQTIPLTAPAIPGAPSEFSPRRMPISTSNQEFDEYEETTTQNTWTRLSTVTATQLGVTFIREPNFTSDGRRVVFIGATSGAPANAIYVAERPSLAVAFGPPAVFLYNDASGADEASPFLTNDCMHLYYTNNNAKLIDHIQ